MDEDDRTALAVLEANARNTDINLARLESKVDAGFARLEARMDRDIGRLEGSVSRLEAKMDQNISWLDAKIDQNISWLDAKMDQNINRLDAKMDAGFKDIKDESRRDLKWTMGVLCAGILFMLGAMGSGFFWLAGRMDKAAQAPWAASSERLAHAHGVPRQPHLTAEADRQQEDRGTNLP